MTWLLCDYGEVLSLPQPAEDKAFLEAVAGREGEELWAPYWAHREAYDRADISAESYWARVLGASPGAERLSGLIDTDMAGWLHPNPASLAATARAAGRGLRLALFSNAPLEQASVLDTVDWLTGFSPRLYSSRLRAVKPEPAAYAAVIRALAVHPAEITFLDDRADNVEAARAAGLQAEIFTDPAQIDAVSGGAGS